MNRRTFLKASICAGSAILLGSYPVAIERNIVTVNHYSIPLDTLPSSFDGFTITHLTDLHLGPLVSESFIDGVIKKANSLNSDIIVCTGDYVHQRNTRKEIDIVWPLLAQLRANHGVYSVLGNHDHRADAERSLYWLKETGQNLRHKSVEIKKKGKRIILGGAGDLWEDTLRIDTTFEKYHQNECCILLSHNPDALDSSFSANISLAICGHTHGGQVRLPFIGAPILPVQNKSYSSGLVSTDRTRLFISRGIGWAIYPVRFNCFPEIAVLELWRTKSRIS